MSNNITITSSTVGAIAVGDGATASNGGTEEPTAAEWCAQEGRGHLCSANY